MRRVSQNFDGLPGICLQHKRAGNTHHERYAVFWECNLRPMLNFVVECASGLQVPLELQLTEYSKSALSFLLMTIYLTGELHFFCSVCMRMLLNVLYLTRRRGLASPRHLWSEQCILFNPLRKLRDMCGTLVSEDVRKSGVPAG